MSKASLTGLKDTLIFENAAEQGTPWGSLEYLAYSAHSYWGREFQHRIMAEMERWHGEVRADNRLLNYLSRCAGYDLSQAQNSLREGNYYDFQWFLGRLAAYALVAKAEEGRLAEDEDSGAAAAEPEPAAVEVEVEA